jgi:formylglycine-generating enzyme required for sulfatase activity
MLCQSTTVRSRFPIKALLVSFVAFSCLVTIAIPTQAAKCPPDSVQVGPVCVDTYEASVWQIAVTKANKALINSVKRGNATLANLTAGGATQLGCTGAPFNQTAYPGNFPNTGQWTPVLGSSPPSPGVYAVSIPGVLPSTCITWFQAAQACRVSGKRLATNLEWQDAAAGTPDPGTDNGTTDCNISAAGNPVNTGSRSNCKSSWGAFDMVGNPDEWVADWSDLNPTTCTNSTSAYGFTGTGDLICFGGDGSPKIPSALVRGGNWVGGAGAGVFTVNGFLGPSFSDGFLGFRCVR